MHCNTACIAWWCLHACMCWHVVLYQLYTCCVAPNSTKKLIHHTCMLSECTREPASWMPKNLSPQANNQVLASMHRQEKSKWGRSPQVKNSCAAFKVPVEKQHLTRRKKFWVEKKNGDRKASIRETATQNNNIKRFAPTITARWWLA